jgi:hypothetical protein
VHFKILLGVPEFEGIWNNLVKKYKTNSLSSQERKLFNMLGKTMKLLSQNPKHNSLCSHEIYELSIEFECRIFESYMQNKTPGAGRLFLTYGPGKGEITVLGFSPHPDDSKGAYKRIKLSGFPIKPEE